MSTICGKNQVDSIEDDYLVGYFDGLALLK